MNGTFKIVSKNCVNSKHTASWLAKEGEESCECIVGCKIKIDLAINGHNPYVYIVSESEYYSFYYNQHIELL